MREYLAIPASPLILAIWKTYRIGIWVRHDNHRGVCLREERQVQFVDYRLKSSMFYKNVHLQSAGRNWWQVWKCLRNQILMEQIAGLL